LQVEPDYLVTLRTSRVVAVPTIDRPVALMSLTNDGAPAGMVRIQVDAFVPMEDALKASSIIHATRNRAA
jgi:hypothetical protein